MANKKFADNFLERGLLVRALFLHVRTQVRIPNKTKKTCRFVQFADKLFNIFPERTCQTKFIWRHFLCDSHPHLVKSTLAHLPRKVQQIILEEKWR